MSPWLALLRQTGASLTNVPLVAPVLKTINPPLCYYPWPQQSWLPPTNSEIILTEVINDHQTAWSYSLFTCFSINFLKFKTNPYFPGRPAPLSFWFFNSTSQSSFRSLFPPPNPWTIKIFRTWSFLLGHVILGDQIHLLPITPLESHPGQGSGLPLFVLPLHPGCMLNYCWWFLGPLFHSVMRAGNGCQLAEEAHLMKIRGL